MDKTWKNRFFDWKESLRRETKLFALLPDAAPREWLEPKTAQRWIWSFLVLGLIARTVRYLLRFPLWDDECFLATNFIDVGYEHLMAPLNYHQVAPLLFLWTELTSVKLFGFNEYSLRLFPYLCSVGSLFLFRRLIAKLLHPSVAVMAMAIFAVSYPSIRYAAEAKQYGSDAFVALVLLVLTVEWWNDSRQRWLWTLAMFTPLAVGLSFPSVFIAGMISLWTGWILLSDRRQGWISWVFFNLALLTSFGLLMVLSAKNQSESTLEFMQSFWAKSMPPIHSLTAFSQWFLTIHTGDLLAYPFGGSRGASTLTFVLCAIGLMALKRRPGMAFFLLAPFTLNFVAALLQRYPYGGHVKFSQYLSPIICILAALGTVRLLNHLSRRPAVISPSFTACLALWSLVAWGTMTRDFFRPEKTPTDQRVRDFARWFWFNMSFEGEAVCVKTDLHRDFSPDAFHELGWSAMYLCNQRIYSPRHAQRTPPHWEKISNEHPMRCVVYRTSVYPFDDQARNQWLEEMQTQFDLISRDTYPIPCYNQRETTLLTVDYLEVYKFVPKPGLVGKALPPDLLR